MEKEKATIGDRFSASIIMFVASFLTALVVWFLVFFFSAKGGGLFTFPFSYVLYFTGLFVFIAFFSPNNSIKYMGWIWKKMDKFFKDLNTDGPS